MSEELKPCPFCGGNANRETGRYALRWAWCENPSCRAFARAELPIDRWNTRPIENALRAELARHQWQQIDTAPKDGTRIVVLCSTGAAYVVRWNANYEEWSIPGSGISGVTHWMPLPEPPAAVDGMREGVTPCPK